MATVVLFCAVTAERFAAHDKVGNRRLLWHGTNVAVVAAIINSGRRPSSLSPQRINAHCVALPLLGLALAASALATAPSADLTCRLHSGETSRIIV